jgi:hypothetical protein
MKTMKTLLIAGIILASAVSKSFAAGNENLNQAYKQLNVQLKDMLKQSLSDKIKTTENTYFVVLSFSVNEKHQMENIRVESNDEDFAKYVKKMLQHKKVEVNPLFDGKSGQVLIMMENEG